MSGVRAVLDDAWCLHIMRSAVRAQSLGLTDGGREAPRMPARAAHNSLSWLASERAEPFFYLAVLTNAVPPFGPALQCEEA